jgi:hypothetical protein
MKAYVGVDVYSFLTSALAGGEWSASHHGRFTPGERAPGPHWIGDCVNPRACLDMEKKILEPTGTRTPTPRSSSPYPVAMPTALSQLFIG